MLFFIIMGSTYSINCYFGQGDKIIVIDCNITTDHICFSAIYNNTKYYDCFDTASCNTIRSSTDQSLKNVVCCTTELCNTDPIKLKNSYQPLHVNKFLCILAVLFLKLF